ncbi:MAG: hypothetical protein IJ511_01240 [Bacteroides sp.]|nr:hypothetical protein [Bacteroides sp.]
MAINIVTYDLQQDDSGERYEKLLELIKDGSAWARLGGSSYLIDCEDEPSVLRDKFKAVLKNGDKLYVGRVSAPAAWIGMPEEVGNWIIKKLS